MSNRTSLRTAVLAAGVLGVAVVPALAADEGGHSPSLFAGDLGNIIWTLLTFIAVLVVLGRFAWTPILTALQKREQFIHDSLAQAKKDRQESEARLKELEQRLTQAKDEAAAIVDEGRRDAEVLKRKLEQDARREADAMLERARREINVARDTALRELYDTTAALATEAAGRIIRKELDPAQHERLIAEALEQLRADGGAGRN